MFIQRTFVRQSCLNGSLNLGIKSFGNSTSGGGSKSIDQLVQEAFDATKTGTINIGYVNDGTILTIIIFKANPSYCPIIALSYNVTGACIVKSGNVYGGEFKGFTNVHS